MLNHYKESWSRLCGNIKSDKKQFCEDSFWVSDVTFDCLWYDEHVECEFGYIEIGVEENNGLVIMLRRV